jgi:hypothetical protein
MRSLPRGFPQQGEEQREQEQEEIVKECQAITKDGSYWRVIVTATLVPNST